MLRGKGIHYDTGTFPNGDTSRPVFDPRDAERDIQVVAEDLHCTAVRITGGDPDRIETTARYAAQAGLEVWFSPFPCELTNAEMLPLFADCAERAERLRRDGAEVVLVTGWRTQHLRPRLPARRHLQRARPGAGGPRPRSRTPGHPRQGRHLPGRGRRHRAAALRRSHQLRLLPPGRRGLDPVRHRGPGRLPGAARNAATYRADLRAECARGKPVAVMEAGCCTYREQETTAAPAGTWPRKATASPSGPASCATRASRSRYLEDLMTVFEEVGVDSAFWFSFAGFSTPHRTTGPDEDLASYGIVKILDEHSDYPVSQRTYPDMPWEPKEAFHALARRYGADGKRADPAAGHAGSRPATQPCARRPSSTSDPYGPSPDGGTRSTAAPPDASPRPGAATSAGTRRRSNSDRSWPWSRPATSPAHQTFRLSVKNSSTWPP
ncbi:hypothetical protein SRIMM317S_04278 [Streptomyces rimosus subsp. rimosus]